MMLTSTRSPVMSLPAEVLLIIFEAASRQSSPRSTYDLDTEVTADTERGDISPDAVQLAFVCRAWMDVIALKPVFWKSLKIAIDGPTFVPSVIKTFFTASRDQLIDLSIAPLDKDSYTLTQAQEQERMDFIMEHVTPHLGRFAKLCIFAFCRSTILHTARFLDGANLTHLSTLHLVSKKTDEHGCLLIPRLTLAALSKLHIDAESFVDLILENDTSWGDDSTLLDLHLTRFSPNSSVGGELEVLSLVEALGQLSEIRDLSLIIEDVKFSYHGDETTNVTVKDVQRLELHSLDGSFVPLICDSIRSPVLEHVHISRCTISPEWRLHSRMRMPGQTLRLTGVESSTSLLCLIQDFQGRKLVVEDCPGFDDWVLGAMAFSLEGHFACPSLTRLEITGTTFSADALRRMCLMRQADAPIEELHVSGGPTIHRDWRMWFEMYIMEFSWKPKMDDAERW
ncbi:hypothetical protein CONPUDRAFT_161869 [Coniophora puteana RWD-64-598 SS2]|uniref:F-box domain-containing protein n=1 Tax=Coniophora puteana (strain RWD-64-598) TaxID=741705 RepID=A0A5M3N7N2_CONPW|nr:uncharacterized protein CONPUDRAFT_161869 [Coniophora puteana RWD-64-598 SS2]EIW87298.1 hypothetical protein CONPUDRAFT_161869 [Coniophora puteana RWD-64-598 SS2]